jgi:predicted PurR-regulated permease PerM
MNKDHKELISIGLTLSIVALSLYIIHRFIPSLLWASIIVIATYPLYKHWRKLFGKHHNIAALLFTLILVVLLIVPISGLISVLVKEIQLFFNYLQHINRHGGKAPPVLHEIPWIGNELVNYWDRNLGEPGHLKNVLTGLQRSITPASYYIRQIGADIAHRSIQMGFTLLSVFFFYRDGDALFAQINRIGELCLGERWFRYANRLPAALRATVNGTIAVGVGVGLLMGICYWLLKFPAPTLLGFITALAAMIPFVVPLVFGVVAIIMAAQGSMLAAIIVVAWGTFVMFIADHMVKPALIGGAIQLPFLAVLFGILGGVETLGLLGLFIGPIIMVLFMTLWYES